MLTRFLYLALLTVDASVGVVSWPIAQWIREAVTPVRRMRLLTLNG